jgi:hypothetical protein
MVIYVNSNKQIDLKSDFKSFNYRFRLDDNDVWFSIECKFTNEGFIFQDLQRSCTDKHRDQLETSPQHHWSDQRNLHLNGLGNLQKFQLISIGDFPDCFRLVWIQSELSAINIFEQRWNKRNSKIN